MAHSFFSPVERRVVRPELLDAAPLPLVNRNLGDLVRINRWFGGYHSLRQVFNTLVCPTDRFSVLDVGAASGDAAKWIRRKYKNAVVVSLDHRIRNLQKAPAPRLVAEATALPFRYQSFDFVLCSLFLHHFSDCCAAALVADLRRFSREALIILDLERHPIAYSFLPLTRWLFRWSEVTLHDGCVSVAAGFKTAEMALITKKAGVRRAVIRRHWPWFRISAVIAEGPPQF